MGSSGRGLGYGFLRSWVSQCMGIAGRRSQSTSSLECGSLTV